MSEPSSLATVDVSRIADPEIRRALRAMHQQVNAVLDRQQFEIETLVELLLDKHVTNIAEFKHHVQRLQQGGSRSARLQGLFGAPAVAAVPAAPAPKPVVLRRSTDPDEHGRYTL